MKRPPWDVCPVRDCDNPAVWSNPGDARDGYCRAHWDDHDPVTEQCDYHACDSCGTYWMGDDW